MSKTKNIIKKSHEILTNDDKAVMKLKIKKVVAKTIIHFLSILTIGIGYLVNYLTKKLEQWCACDLKKENYNEN